MNHHQQYQQHHHARRDPLPKLMRKLEHHSAIVESLLRKPTGSLRAFSEVCKEKINTLEELIMELPASVTVNVLNKWRSEVTRLWEWYFTVVGSLEQENGDGDDDDEEHCSDEEVVKPRRHRRGSELYLHSSSSSLNSLAFIGGDDNDDGGSEAEELTPPHTSFSESSQTCGGDSGGGGHRRYRVRVDSKPSSFELSLQSYDEDEDKPGDINGHCTTTDHEAEKRQIRRQIRSYFTGIMAVENHSDIDALKQLLMAVAKACKPLAAAEWIDDHFQREMLKSATALLAEDQRDQFADECVRGLRQARMTDLKVFISQLIGNHFKSLNRSFIERDLRARWYSSTHERVCRYCKAIGHDIDQCTEVNGQVCFKCFKPGHKAKYCEVEGKKCFKCGRSGHFARYCTKYSYNNNFSRR